MDGYRPRVVDAEIDALHAALAAVAIDGAKAVGKTETARQRAATLIGLDDPGRRAVVAADIDAALDAPAPVLIDEWQHVPEVWDRVRRRVDAGAPPGSFLLTGSAGPRAAPAHSGAGRIVRVRMRPLSLHERHPAGARIRLADLLAGGRPPLHGTSTLTLTDYVQEIERSGYPGLRDLPGRALRAQIGGYIDGVIDRDFPEFGRAVRRPDALRRWLAAYAAATATTATFEAIRDASTAGDGQKPAKSTLIPYRDILERLFVLEAVPAWQPTRNRISQLGLPPKHHLVDPALAVGLLGLSTDALLSGAAPRQAPPGDGAFVGRLFESLVTQSVRVYAQAVEARIGHLRTRGGTHEVDLVVERHGGGVVAMEVKLGANIDDRAVHHLHWLAERLGDELLDAVVITTGPEAYRRRDGIGVIPAAMLSP